MFRPVALVALLLLAPIHTQNHLAAQASTAHVTGRVVDVATGEPIAGARVILGMALAPGQKPSAPPALPSRPVTGETNADGVFVMNDVPQGRWRVQVQKTGFYLAGTAPVIDVASASVTAPEIRLDRGGAVTGRVVDAQGHPISELSVVALQRMPGPNATGGPGANSTSGQTNDLGEFRLSGLPPGDYHVLARPRPVSLMNTASAPSATTFVQTYYPGVADVRVANTVTVTRGGTTQAIDFQMLVEAAFQVSGVAVDASGRPAAGASVRLFPSSRPPLAASFSATARPDGTFQIVNVPAGTYRVQAAMPVVTRTATGVSTSLSFGVAGPGGPEVVVNGGDVAGVRVTLP
jgi:hypothetical protein